MPGKYDKSTVKRLLNWVGGDRMTLITYLKRNPEEKDMLWRVMHYTDSDIEKEAKKGVDDIYFRQGIENRVEGQEKQNSLREFDEWEDYNEAHALLHYLHNEAEVEEILNSNDYYQLQTNYEELMSDVEDYKGELSSDEYKTLIKNFVEAEKKFYDHKFSGTDVYGLVILRRFIRGLHHFEYNGKEWAICDSDVTEEVALQFAKNIIDSILITNLNQSFVEEYIDGEQVANDFEDTFRSCITDSPESYLNENERALSESQEEEIEAKMAEIQVLEEEREELDLNTPEGEARFDEITDEVSTLDEEITEIEENPDGEWDEDKIEKKVEEMMDEARKDPLETLKQYGITNYSAYVDLDDLAQGMVDADGYGQIISSYDGSEINFTYLNTYYSIFRMN